MSGEAHESFECFGGTVGVHVRAPGGAAEAKRARAALLAAHRSLSRFDPGSELSRLNRDPREAVPASPLLRRLAAAVRAAGALSGGLVDATLLGEIERLGYTRSLAGGDAALAALPSAGRVPARPSPRAAWRSISVDEKRGCVLRPNGVQIDGGGIAKGLLADLIGERLSESRSFAVDCCGDIRIGGTGERPRTVRVEDPFGPRALHEFTLLEGAVATSGITRRAWLGPDAAPAHQIVDPSTGRAAFTGVVQATALAPTALEAETRAKAALLSGPDRAAAWLPFGGVLLTDRGELEVLSAERPLSPRSAAA